MKTDKKYITVFVSTPIESDDGVEALYEVVGLCANGLEYICTLNEDLFTHEIFQFSKNNEDKYTRKFYRLRDAMHILHDELTAIPMKIEDADNG